tara:strand:+ start:11501 stop:11686 length:186 start_codon:yes stop_codon:yes gene_type:complete
MTNELAITDTFSTLRALGLTAGALQATEAPAASEDEPELVDLLAALHGLGLTRGTVQADRT